MNKIGLYFGTFNPIHIGHLLVATNIKEAAQLDEIWFVVSPQNPFKIETDLANETHRLEMVKLATKNNPSFKVSTIEFQLPKPSYTYLSLQELTTQFPENQFKLIIGEDNVSKFNEWKEATWIQQHFNVLVYERRMADGLQYSKNMNSKFIKYQLPLFDISATNIRNRIKNKQAITYFVTENVEQYIAFHKLYS